MEIQFFGGNCIRIITRKASIVIDDNLAALGAKNIVKPEDITISTNNQLQTAKALLHFDMPGEYEASDISLQGIAARGHMDDEQTKSATIFKVVAADISVVILGHIYPELSDAQLEQIGHVDVLFVPVGNSGYTVDAIGALKLIKKIEPRTVVPTHYADGSLHFEVPQVALEDALKDLAMEPKETIQKLKLKQGEMSETLQLVILEKS